MVLAAAARRTLLATLALTACAGPSAAVAVVTPPPANGRFDYQIGGAYPPAASVRIVDRDRRDAPVAGRYNVCYVNAFQAQPDAARWWRDHHPDLLLRRDGRPVVDATWNELLLDTSTPARRRGIAAIVGRWIDRCGADGFQAVEPDNLDSWTRSQGRLTRPDNLALAALLIARAHRAGLAIAQKNAAELGASGRALGFDFAIAEECFANDDECGAYTRAYSDQVYEIEYDDNGGPRNAAAACAARGARISITYRDRDVAPRGSPRYAFRSC